MKAAMLGLGIIIGCILGSATHDAKGGIDPAEAVRLAYKMGQEDAMYRFDDLNTKRLTQNDVEDLIGE